MAATDSLRLQAVLTVTIDAEGDYYFDHADLLAHVVPWIEGGLDDRDNIRKVTITEQALTVDRAALRDRIAEVLARADGWGDASGALRDMGPSAREHYDKIANAVLAALPAAAEAEFELRGTAEIRGAVLREAAEVVYGMDTDPSTEAAAAEEPVQGHRGDAVTAPSVDVLRERAEAAEKRIQAITEATAIWRDRPGGDIGLAIALAGILDTDQPEPPASAALVRALRECDRIEREVHGQHDEDDDGMREAVRRIRAAIDGTGETS